MNNHKTTIQNRKMNFDQRKEQILTIAFHQFARDGFKKTTIRSIAKEAKVSEALLYKYFPSKNDLLSEIRYYVRIKAKKMMEYLDPSKIEIENTEDLYYYLGLFFDRFVEVLENNPQIIRFAMYAKLEDEDFAALMIPPETLPESPIVRIFETAIQKKLVRQGEPMVYVRSFFALMSSFCSPEISNLKKKSGNENLKQRAFQILFHGILDEQREKTIK